MRYLKQRRTQLILMAFASSCALLYSLPLIDIEVSRFFFERGGFDKALWWQEPMHEVTTWFLAISVGGVTLLYGFNRLSKRNLLGLDGRRLVYLLLVLIVGAGLIVNLVLKDNFGRARPRDIAEFGGLQDFSRPFEMVANCNKNCSFASGEGAGSFFALALAVALSRRRAALALALAFGTVVSLSRIAAGAHFFSDTVVSFFVMLLLTDALYFFVVLTHTQRARIRLRGFTSAPVG